MKRVWIQPVNAKKYDFIGNLHLGDRFAIKKIKRVRNNDIVLIYLSKPFAMIKYVCRVYDDNLTAEDIPKNSPIDNSQISQITCYGVVIENVYENSDETVKLSNLKKHYFHAQPLISLADHRLLDYLNIKS